MNVVHSRIQTIMAGKRYRPIVRKVTLDQIILAFLRKGNLSRVICVMVVLVATVFALNLINLFHLETLSTRESKGKFESETFFVHEANRILPVMQRGMMAPDSVSEREPPESILLREHRMVKHTPLDAIIQRRERRGYVEKVQRDLVGGNAKRTTLFGPDLMIKDNLSMQDGDAVDYGKIEERKELGIVLANESRVNHSVDLSVRDTKRIPKMQRYNKALKGTVTGIFTNNGHIRYSKTLNGIFRQRRQNNNLKNRDIKGEMFPLEEGMEALNVANKTARQGRSGLHSLSQSSKAKLSNVNDIGIRGNCARLITIYTSSITPFGYWPEYSDLRRLFEDGKRYSGNIDSSPTGYVVCPDQPCDINLIPTNDDNILVASDAILLNVAPLLAKPHVGKISERLVNTLPKKVKIILYGMESANMMTIWDNSIRDIQFHYSMTYHSSSDLVHPYGRYIQGNPMDNPDKPVNYTKGKTKILAWMASNCNYTFWPRYEWVSRLQEFIQVDTYGKCGQITCLPRLSEKCVKMMRSYKFYLALENTQCDEYVTEKFWDNCLLNGVVPVVYGGRRETYKRIAPPGSFIYAGDFASPKELADHLIMLDKDDERYSKFFGWRKVGRVEKIYPNLRPTAFCDLLPLLSTGDNERVPIKRAGDTEYFLGCREDKNARFSERGDINNWSIWK